MCDVALPPVVEVSKLASLSLSQTYAHLSGVAHVFQSVKLLWKLAMDQGQKGRGKDLKGRIAKRWRK